MITRNLLTLIAFGGVVALVACTTAAADKYASSSDFCNAKAEAECNNIAKKCGASIDACKSTRVATCNSAASAATGQGRAYRSSAVQDCIDKINDVYKDGASNVTPTGEKDAATVCDRVFGGNKQERDTCGNTYECAAPLICDSVCAKQETVSLNAGCGNAGQVCDTGTYCQPQGGKSFCVAKKALGDICAVADPCVETLRCVNHCVAKETVGQACDTDDDCVIDAPFCDRSTTPKKCRPKYESDTSACKAFGSTL